MQTITQSATYTYMIAMACTKVPKVAQGCHKILAMLWQYFGKLITISNAGTALWQGCLQSIR